MSEERGASAASTQGGWWAVYAGTAAIGLGRGMHAAMADASRRTGSLEARQCRIQPVADGERDALAGRLGPGGITDAESAFCSGTMTSEPTYNRPVAAMKTVLAATHGLGARVDGNLIQFQDGSRIELIALRKDLVPSYRSTHTVRLPRDRRQAAPHTRGSEPASLCGPAWREEDTPSARG